MVPRDAPASLTCARDKVYPQQMEEDSPSPAQEPGGGLPRTNPDVVEQEQGDIFDNIIPTRGYQMTPMVALGGSAGSIPAMQAFFRAVPPDSGLVFVIIIHLAPRMESNLPEILARSAAIPVIAAEDGMKVQPNVAYVIPPGQELVTIDGHLRLKELRNDYKGRRVVVDLFFRSLADTHGPHAAAIVLSGGDGDGALGIKRIKERGGLTIAQDPDEADTPGMPRAAIETSMVDWVLPVHEIPHRLLSYFRQERILRLPSEEGPQPALPAVVTPDLAESALREVLVYLRTRTGCDFSYYKRATILRRIGRRLQVNGVDDIVGYLSFLRTHPGEAGALLQDLLISVTNFFRDRDAFAALEAEIPSLFANKAHTESVRVWVPACATGEEAYSIAMLLLEHARTLDTPPPIQVFACDLDSDAIASARAGLYPEAIVADVNEDRLRRFFVKEHHGYRVRRELRESVLFAVHDLLKDAPFSRMDLISCRNLLIYLNRDAQRRVLETFHFALKPNSLLFLGSSESIEDNATPYRVIDAKHRLFRHEASSRTALPVPVGPSTLTRVVEQQEQSTGPVTHGRRFLNDLHTSFGAFPKPTLDRSALAEFHFRMLERLAPPSLLINADYEIIHLSEQAGRFLSFVGGEPSNNLLRVVHPMIRIELRAALFRATETGTPSRVPNIPVDLDGVRWTVDLRVHPAPEISQGFMLVILDAREATDTGGTSEHIAASDSEPLVRQLERELELVKGHLRDTVEQYEASTEEMKASNEELQAMNEELRSATEELETSREELQSINEELTTVNAEMKSKVDELASTNSDLQNLMASTAIATVFLDRDLSITRYTPSAVELFHLIPTDIGRPLAHLKHRLDYPELIADAERVLRTLVPTEREVRDDSRWFQARVQPYRTVEDHIAGVVLTCVDVTDRKQAAQALHERVEELTRFNAAAVGREMRMIELKREVNAIRARLGEPPAYPLDFDTPSGNGRD